MDFPVFSIVITVFNRPELLCRQLRYIEENTRDFELPFEVIVYDDCSDEPIVVPDVNINVKLCRGELNVGLIEARNRAFELVSESSKHVLVVDDDIFVFNLKEAIRVSVEYIENERYAVVSIPYINLPLDYRAKVEWFKFAWDGSPGSTDSVFFNGGSSVYDKAVFKSLGGFEGRYRMYLEEEDYALRLFCEGRSIRVAFDHRFLSLHDQAGGKVRSARLNFLLSNRLLYHRKFVSNYLLRWALNCFYVFAYCMKSRDLKIIGDALSRYKEMRHGFSSCGVPTRTFVRFLMKRYFNI